MTNLDSALKSRDITLPTKFHIVKAMVFPVVMYRCRSWTIQNWPKNWCFWTGVLEKTLESPLDYKRIKSVNPKGNQPEYSLEGLCWSWSSNTLATWCEEPTYWKRPWCWERLKAGGEGNDRGWDGWMVSPTQWTWVWANSRSGWRTEKPACHSPWGCKESDTTEWLSTSKHQWLGCSWNLDPVPSEDCTQGHIHMPLSQNLTVVLRAQTTQKYRWFYINNSKWKSSFPCD